MHVYAEIKMYEVRLGVVVTFRLAAHFMLLDIGSAVRSCSMWSLTCQLNRSRHSCILVKYI